MSLRSGLVEPLDAAAPETTARSNVGATAVPTRATVDLGVPILRRQADTHRRAMPAVMARTLAPQVGNRGLMRLVQRDPAPAPAPGQAPAGGGGPATPGIALNEANKKRAEKILGDAFGKRKGMGGQVQFLDDAALRAKHDEMQIRLGRNNKWDQPWTMGDNARTFRDFFGFADQAGGTVYVLTISGGGGAMDGTDQLATVVHELLHVNAAGDWAGAVGGAIDEGVTETLTKKACSAAGVTAKEAYAGQIAFADKLAKVVGQGTLESAYFGGASVLRAAFDAVQGDGAWDRFSRATGEKKESMLSAKHSPDWVKEKIYQINDLLDGWVSDADLDRVAAIWATLEGAEKDQVRSAIQPRVGDLTDIGQRTRLRVILGS